MTMNKFPSKKPRLIKRSQSQDKNDFLSDFNQLISNIFILSCEKNRTQEFNKKGKITFKSVYSLKDKDLEKFEAE